MGNPQAGTLYHRDSPTGVKVLSPISGSPARESGFEGQWGLTAGIPQDQGRQKLQSWRAHTGSRAHQDPGEKISDLIRDWARLICQYWKVSCEGGEQLWLTAGTRTWVAAVLRSTHWCEPSWRPPFSHQDLAPANSLQAPVPGRLRPNNQQGGNTAPPISRQAA